MRNIKGNRACLQGGVIAVFVVVFVALSAARGFGQCTLSSPSQWNVTSGNWSVAGNWTPASVPNSSTTNVCLTNGTSGTAATTVLDISATVADLQLGSFNSLSILTGQTLVVAGASISNAGAITLNGGAGNNGFLNIGNNVTLTGGGTLTLSTTALNGGNAVIQQSVSGLTLTNANNTIQGNGIIGNNGLALVNQSSGVIDATTASGLVSTLTLNGGGAITNQGLMEATTGTLVIQNAVTNTGGNITAKGGTVDVNSTITGGTLNTVSGGTMQTFNGSATLDGVTISSGSTYTASDGATTHLQGTITNKGTILLNGGAGNNGFLNIDNNVTLTGAGTLTLSTTALNGGNAIIQQNVSGITLTNSNNTIQGNGIIGSNGLAVSNAATIDANVSGATLLLNGGGTVTNTGTLEATGGGILQIQNPVANAGGNITAASGSAVQIEWRERDRRDAHQ